MPSRAKIEQAVTNRITLDHQLGESPGGSGHMSDVGLRIDEIKDPVEAGGGVWLVDYSYTLIVVTEFTVYPDNPPYEYTYSRQIRVDGEGELLDDS